MNYETIEFTISEGVAKLTLNRPDKFNSFNDQMHSEVKHALETCVEDNTVRCLLLTANGRGFCAGQDLGDRNVAPNADPPDLGSTLEANYNPLIRRLRGVEFPTVCAVNGVAAGAGASIALACDIVYAARSAKFIQAFCKVGLLPDSGGTWILPRLVGHARAMAMSMLGTPITSEQAESWGLIWKCVDDEELMTEAEALSKHLATQPTKGLALIKKAINVSMSNDLDSQLDLERDYQRIAGKTTDYREGVSAFMNKRTPEFRGE